MDGEKESSHLTASAGVRTALVGRVLLVYWFASPDPDSLRAAMADLKSARASASEPLIVCAYVPEGVPPPPPEVRRLIIELTPAMLESCSSIHTVQEGAGVVATAFRAVGRAMVIVGGYWGKVFIHRSLEDFLGASYHELGASPTQVRSEIERMGRSNTV
jgi:hypothetical protein